MTTLGLEILAALALIGALLFGVHKYDERQQEIGAQTCEISTQKSVAAAVSAQAASTAAETARNTELAKQLEAAKGQREIRYATITRNVDHLVDRPVYSNVCIDDDGLRNINAALSGASAPAASGDLAGSAAALPSASAAER